MNDKCIEIGMIQAYLDGESSPELSFRISGHVAKCDNCAQMLAEADEENVMVFSVLDREFNSMVPTKRLWASINEAIGPQKSHTSIWQRVFGSLTIMFANPSITVAASVLLVAGLFAAFWSLKPVGLNNADIIATTDTKARPVNETMVNNTVPAAGTNASDDVQGQRSPLNVTASNLPADQVRKLVSNANYRPSNERPKPQYLVNRPDEYLPGEESYVRTIADLNKNVEGQKDRILSPSSRIAYERDMALVNDAITKMKDVVKRNPKNQSAKQVLYSSYQNKIELLNSVVQREELLVSLR